MFLHLKHLLLKCTCTCIVILKHTCTVLLHFQSIVNVFSSVFILQPKTLAMCLKSSYLSISSPWTTIKFLSCFTISLTLFSMWLRSTLMIYKDKKKVANKSLANQNTQVITHITHWYFTKIRTDSRRRSRPVSTFLWKTNRLFTIFNQKKFLDLNLENAYQSDLKIREWYF